jgi:hypothetical protein
MTKILTTIHALPTWQIQVSIIAVGLVVMFGGMIYQAKKEEK